jgi:hypothetical protein
VPRQCHEGSFDEPLLNVFAALLAALARHRWAEGAPQDASGCVPRVGCRYANKRGTLLRRGRVLECLRPVSLTLYETLFDAPCRVRLKIRWRLESVEAGCLLRLEMRYDLNGAATIRHRHWHRQLHAHGQRMLGFVGRQLRRQSQAHASTRIDPTVQAKLSAQGAAGTAGMMGHSQGNSSIATTNTKTVSGKPSFR